MNKKKTGRRMMTREEIKTKYMPWFMSKAWQKRKVDIRIKIAKREQPELAKKLGL